MFRSAFWELTGCEIPLAAEQQQAPVPPAAFPGLLSAQRGRMRPTVARTDREGQKAGVKQICCPLGLRGVVVCVTGVSEDGSGVRESHLLLVNPSGALRLTSETRAVWSRRC